MLVVPLISPPLVQVLVGDRAEFSYLIALVDSSNVTSSVSVVYRGPTDEFIGNLELLDQGEDVYTFSIPSVSLAMDGAEFVLQFEEIDILNSQVFLRVLGMYVQTYECQSYSIQFIMHDNVLPNPMHTIAT